jgi:hypothetical protein
LRNSGTAIAASSAAAPPSYAADELDGLGRRGSVAGDQCIRRLPKLFHDRSTTADNRVGAADDAGRHHPVGVDGVAQQPTVGNTHRAEVRVHGSAGCPPRLGGVGRGGSRRQPNPVGDLGGDPGPALICTDVGNAGVSPCRAGLALTGMQRFQVAGTTDGCQRGRHRFDEGRLWNTSIDDESSKDTVRRV